MVPAHQKTLEEEEESEAEVEDENEGRSGFVIGARPPVAALRPNSYEVRIERVQRDIYDFFLSNTDHEIEVHSLPSYFPGRDGEWVRLKGKSRKAVKAKQPQTGDYSQSWAHHIRYVNTECSSPLSREFTSIKPNALFYAIILDTWSRTGNNIGYVGYVGAAFKSVEKQLQSHKRAAKKILRFYQHLVAEGRPFETSPSTSLFEHLVARVFLGEGELVNTVAVFTIYTKEEDDEDEAPGESQRLSQVVDGPPLDGSPSKTKRRRRKKEDRSPEEEKADRERKLQRKKERKELQRLAQSKVEQFALAGLLGANRH